MTPKVTLISWTRNPIQTIAALWKASREHGETPDTEHSVTKEEFEIFKKVVESKIPVSENLNFVFLLENVSISFREQMVRHRIGVKVGERLGADLIPDIASSTWWSQTMRVLDMSSFHDEGRFRIPESLEGKEGALDAYNVSLKVAQDTYQRLVKEGVPAEDAREVLPMATQHRISWSLHLASIQHIIGKRTCWIAQSELWEPIIRGMVEEMANKVHPYFATLINPPCIKDGKFDACCFKIENERRMDGQDPIPPCSLYLQHHTKDWNETLQWTHRKGTSHVPFKKLYDKYSSMWKRDGFTGELL